MKLEDFKYSVDYSKLEKVTPSQKTYDLFDPKERMEYFEFRCGEEIQYIKKYLERNTFIGYLVSPKFAGKGSYSVLFQEIFGRDKVENISVGDLVRNADEEYQEKGKKSEIYEYVKEKYRGLMTLDEIFDCLTGRSHSKLLPDDFILLLIKREIDRLGRKAIFLDGFPRHIDQVKYSLLLKELINYRDDPDFFVLINVPMQVVQDRIKGRRACPKCGNQRNIILSPTNKVTYNKQSKEFELYCDNGICSEEKMVKKEGDDKGIETIRERMENDLDLMQYSRKIYGVPSVEIYNAVEIDKADEYTYPYERTFVHKLDFKDGKIVKESVLYVPEEDGKKYVSVVQAPPVVQMIQSIARLLGFKS